MLTLDVTGIDETSSSMRVLRTWSGSDMAGLGDDSLGTFLLLALNDQTQLAANTPHLYIAVSAQYIYLLAMARIKK